MHTILNGKAIKSQPLDVNYSSESGADISEHVNTIKAILYSRDKVDLLLLEYILKANIEENRDVSVEDTMSYMKMSNPPLSVRLRRLRVPEAGKIEIALLKAVKNGNPFFYRFTDLIPLELALSLVQDNMKRKGISYEIYCADKGIIAEQDSGNNEEVSDEELDTDTENLESEENQADGEMPLEIDFEELSSKVTMGQVLAMLDENNNRVVNTISETFAQILDEKLNEINTRIKEIEQKLNQPTFSKINQESLEELTQRARLLVRQKLFSSFTTKSSEK